LLYLCLLFLFHFFDILIQVVKQETKSSQNTKSDNIIIIKLNNLTITFKDNLLVYPKKRIFLLFDNNSSYSKMQENVLKNLNVTYIKTNNQYLKNYFQIQKYPSIIILDKNKTVKFENFVPYEILKAEGY